MRVVASGLGNVLAGQYRLCGRNCGIGLKVRPATQGSPQCMPSSCLGRPMVRGYSRARFMSARKAFCTQTGKPWRHSPTERRSCPLGRLAEMQIRSTSTSTLALCAPLSVELTRWMLLTRASEEVTAATNGDDAATMSHVWLTPIFSQTWRCGAAPFLS